MLRKVISPVGFSCHQRNISALFTEIMVTTGDFRGSFWKRIGELRESHEIPSEINRNPGDFPGVLRQAIGTLRSFQWISTFRQWHRSCFAKVRSDSVLRYPLWADQNFSCSLFGVVGLGNVASVLSVYPDGLVLLPGMNLLLFVRIREGRITGTRAGRVPEVVMVIWRLLLGANCVLAPVQWKYLTRPGSTFRFPDILWAFFRPGDLLSPHSPGYTGI
jgi:hypothetical protein